MFQRRRTDIYGTHSITYQYSFVAVEVAVFEERAPSGSDLIYEKPWKIVKPDPVVVDDDEDWDLECIMTAKELKASELRGKN